MSFLKASIKSDLYECFTVNFCVCDTVFSYFEIRACDLHFDFSNVNKNLSKGLVSKELCKLLNCKRI